MKSTIKCLSDKRCHLVFKGAWSSVAPLRLAVILNLNGQSQPDHMTSWWSADFFEGKGNVWNLNFESECSLIWMKVVWLIFYDSYWLLRNNIIIYRSYNLILLFQWHFQTVMISLFSLFIHFCNNIIWRRWSWLATRLATAYWLSLSLVMSLGQVWNFLRIFFFKFQKMSRLNSVKFQNFDFQVF